MPQVLVHKRIRRIDSDGGFLLSRGPKAGRNMPRWTFPVRPVPPGSLLARAEDQIRQSEVTEYLRIERHRLPPGKLLAAAGAKVHRADLRRSTGGDGSAAGTSKPDDAARGLARLGQVPRLRRGNKLRSLTRQPWLAMRNRNMIFLFVQASMGHCMADIFVPEPFHSLTPNKLGSRYAKRTRLPAPNEEDFIRSAIRYSVGIATCRGGTADKICWTEPRGGAVAYGDSIEATTPARRFSCRRGDPLSGRSDGEPTAEDLFGRQSRITSPGPNQDSHHGDRESTAPSKGDLNRRDRQWSIPSFRRYQAPPPPQ